MTIGPDRTHFLERVGSASRSLIFAASYILYLGLVMAPIQRLLLEPWLRRRPRPGLLRSWLRLQARVVLALARALADLRLTVHGGIAPESCIVLMNHQSILDVPIGVSLVPGPYPLIPTRASYRDGIPGISRLVRMGGHPFVGQRRTATREELAALRSAAEQVARGERSFLTFPEGHRSRDGRILPFMTSGLRLVMSRARRRPVYVVVVDGLCHLRTFRDVLLHLAGARVHVAVLGPYTIPAEEFQLGPFIETLRQRMIETLGRLRSPGADLPAVARPHLLVG